MTGPTRKRNHPWVACAVGVPGPVLAWFRRAMAADVAVGATFAMAAVITVGAALQMPTMGVGQAIDLQKVRQLLDSAQLTAAQSALQHYESSHPASAALSFHKGLVRYYQGAYAQALALTDSAIANAATEEQRATYRSARQLQASTVETTQQLQAIASPDGRYVVKFQPGKDAIVARYALDILQRADQSLQRVLGLRVPTPVRLEIYPSASHLANVSALTVEQIETTGTIALSKWNRLMITSPRALVRGYPWADTITHEFVHMVLSQLTHERAPVWLQEGTAKMLERSWRGAATSMRLDPAAAGLLADAKRDGTLLTFEQMHPSIAMLPSQDAAALAFAEVSTFINGYVLSHGREALSQALERIRDGQDARDALASACGKPFAELEATWKAALPSQPAQSPPRPLSLRLKGKGPMTDESLDVEQATAKRFLRLGDLLWDRGRQRAAATEYAKAAAAAQDDPIIASRLARAALSSRRPAQALAAVEKMVELYPDHAPSQAMLGAATLALGDKARAARALREAIFINPFDPQPHCDLVKASPNVDEQATELANCEQLK